MQESGIITERVGRRTYIKGNTYPIKDAIKNAGGRWDPDVKAWWLGSDEKAQEIAGRLGPRVEKAAEERHDFAAECERRRAANLTVEAKGTYDYTDRLKKLGGIWDSKIKRWLFPDQETVEKVRALLGEIAQEKAASRAERRKEKNYQPGKDEVWFRRASDGKGDQGPEVGHVFRLQNSGYYIVTGGVRKYKDEHDEDDYMHGGYGWMIGYYARPATAEESAERREQDEAKIRKAEAGKTLEQIASSLRSSCDNEGHVCATPPAGGRKIEFRSATGEAGLGHIVIGENAVYAWHPGYYDDYRRTCGSSSDRDLVLRAQEAAGQIALDTVRV